MRITSLAYVIAIVLVVSAALLSLSGVVLGQSSAAEDEAAIPFALPKSGPFEPADISIDNDEAISDWFRSAHADAAAEAFRHWDDDEEIRPTCAVCHSGEGFRAFHGLDGSEPGVVEGPIDVGGVVDCGTCHNAGLADVTEVLFPSGLMHPVQGVEASCLTCHQGRTAGITVQQAIAGQDPDALNSTLRFINPHYATAAATWLGGYGGAGFHYEGREYSGRFFHARPVSSCNSCHEPHRLEVGFEACLTCHQADTPASIRVTRQSYDGSGDTRKGIRSDIQANAARLLDLIETYAADVAKAPILYDGSRYPYFFEDGNGDGVIDMAEGRPVTYESWTPRSLRAAYNWKLVTSDPGNYAHNPYYAFELLYDSIDDLSEPLGLDVQSFGILR